MLRSKQPSRNDGRIAERDRDDAILCGLWSIRALEPMMSLQLHEQVVIAENLFPESAASAFARNDFPWHRDSAMRPTASRAESSQALAIDVFGVLDSLENGSRVVKGWMSEMQLADDGSWRAQLEYLVPRKLLGEPRSTQVDAVLSSEAGVVFVECKFTESDGGSCSQTRVIKGHSKNAGQVQCNGKYFAQANPVNSVTARCALTGKGIRYWEGVPRVLQVASDRDYDPCPFRDGAYQWMRNLVSCEADAAASGRRGAFVVVFAEGPFPIAAKVKTAEWQAFVAQTDGMAVPLRTISYQRLLEVAVAAALPADRRVLERLESWVDAKIARVAAARVA